MEPSRGLTLRAPRRGEGDSEDSAGATAEHQADRHVAEDSQPEHEPQCSADQHAYDKPCSDGRHSDALVVRHTIIVPDKPPEASVNTANLESPPGVLKLSPSEGKLQRPSNRRTPGGAGRQRERPRHREGTDEVSGPRADRAACLVIRRPARRRCRGRTAGADGGAGAADPAR